MNKYVKNITQFIGGIALFTISYTGTTHFLNFIEDYVETQEKCVKAGESSARERKENSIFILEIMNNLNTRIDYIEKGISRIEEKMMLYNKDNRDEINEIKENQKQNYKTFMGYISAYPDSGDSGGQSRKKSNRRYNKLENKALIKEYKKKYLK